MDSYGYRVLARDAAAKLVSALGIDPEHPPSIGCVLGTGWGKTLDFGPDSKTTPFADIPGFSGLQTLEGHARQVVYGKVADKPVIALRGRVHANEDVDTALRIQIEMLVHLGVKTLILTCAAGSLDLAIDVGSVVLIDELITLFAPQRPLCTGEFCTPNSTIDTLKIEALESAFRSSSIRVHRGKHVMVLGPDFEGPTDKKILASFGASVVGMSILPEVRVAALYAGVKVIPIAFVTNDAVEKHSHTENQRRAEAASPYLGALLEQVITSL